MQMRARTLVVVVPMICFAAAWVDIGVAAYNEAVARYEAERVTRAIGGPTIGFSSCGGVNIAGRNRGLILLLSVPAFILSLWRESRRYAFLCHVVMALLAYQWVSWTVEGLRYAESYRAKLPYVLRLADPSDWTLFLAIAVTLVCWSYFALLESRRDLLG